MACNLELCQTTTTISTINFNSIIINLALRCIGQCYGALHPLFSSLVVFEMEINQHDDTTVVKRLQMIYDVIIRWRAFHRSNHGSNTIIPMKYLHLGAVNVSNIIIKFSHVYMKWHFKLIITSL